MKRTNFYSLLVAALLCLPLSLISVAAQAQQSQSSVPAPPEPPTLPDADNLDTDTADAMGTQEGMGPRGQRAPRFWWRNGWRNRDNDRSVVFIGADANLAVGQQADDVVAIAGSASNAGEVSRSVVSVMGNTKVTGPVGENAVAVLGNVYVNSKVDRDVVAVLGDVELGPQAEVDGKVVAVMGNVIRDPAAVVRSGVQNVGMGLHFDGADGLEILGQKNCFFYGRLLAFAPGLAWAWGLAFGSLVLYVLTALMFPRGVERCVQTLETQPGRSVLTAFLSVFLTPLLFVMLAITIIGILAMPLLGIALLAIESFGKLVMLAWLGRTLTKSFKEGVIAHIAFAVLVGGLIVTGLYVVPVLGLVLYKLLGIIGFGVVTYTLIQAAQTKRTNGHTASPAAGAGNASSYASGFVHSNSSQVHSAAVPNSEVNDPTFQADAQNETQGIHASKDQTNSAIPLEYPRAEFSVRMGALLIDAVLAIVVFSWLPGSFLIALAVYGAMMWKLKGTTIGGIVCHLQVVRVDGRELDWATVIVRALSCFLSLFIAGLGFIWIVFDDDKQAWHDKIAGTVVVRTPKGMSLV